MEIFISYKKMLIALINNPLDRSPIFTKLLRGFTLFKMFLFANGSIVVPWIADSKLLVMRNDPGIKNSIYFGVPELEMIFFMWLGKFLKSSVPGEEIGFLDVGANSGDYTILFSKVLGYQGLSFEPDQVSFSRLKANVDLNNVSHATKLFSNVVGRNNSFVQFTSDLDQMNHVIPLSSSAAKSDSSSFEQIHLDGLENYTKNFDRIIIKCDVEGYESEVFAGSRKLLNSGKVLAIVAESNSQSEIFNRSHADLIASLSPFKFNAYFLKVDSFGFRLMRAKPYSLHEGNFVFFT
jgi:FkbM family methyltransferase